MYRVVTISAGYGAGGSVIGPAVADALGMAFLDRLVQPQRVGVPSGEGAGAEERTSTLMQRVVATFANLPDAFGPGAPPAPTAVGQPDDDLQRATEERVREFVAEHGSGVILGWGATHLLSDAFHVRLRGPVERRIERAMGIEGLERPEAERRQQETDRIRGQYLRRIHGRDWNDMSLFHLVLDSTCMSFEDSARVLSGAATAFWAQADRSPGRG